MNNRIRYTFDEVQCAAFYQLPKFLLDSEFENLSNDARVLYTLLRDRHELSIKNDWYNEKGEVYFIMTRAEMESMLKLSPKTTRKVITELKNLNLIDEQRRGKMQPNLIYLLKVKTTRSKPGKTPLCDREKVTVMSGKNSPSRALKNPPHEGEKFPPININHTLPVHVRLPSTNGPCPETYAMFPAILTGTYNPIAFGACGKSIFSSFNF